MKRAWAIVVGMVLSSFAAGALFSSATSCSPHLGDTASSVARTCGQPNAKRAVVTSYGAKREEWDYSRLIVIEDGVVIGSLGWEPK